MACHQKKTMVDQPTEDESYLFFIFLKYLGEEAEGDEWPNQGVVEFKDVFLRYSEFDDWILKGISFKTKPIEKVFTIYILKS